MQNIFQIKLIKHNLLAGVRNNGADKGSEESSVVGVLYVVVVLVETVLQLEGEGVIVGTDNFEDLFFRWS